MKDTAYQFNIRHQLPFQRHVAGCHMACDIVTYMLGQITLARQTRSIHPFMQHYQVPSAEYSSYINHVISLGLAEDYIAQMRASCSPNSPPSLRAAIDQACRHLSGLVDDLQPVPAPAPGVHSLKTWGQQNGAPVSEAAVALAAAMPNTPEEEARILRITQGINARHAVAKPQNTVQAEKSAAKLWKVGTAWPLLLFLWRP